MPISCHLRDCKALLVTSLTRVSGAIASAPTFTFKYSFLQCGNIKVKVIGHFYVCVCQILFILHHAKHSAVAGDVEGSLGHAFICMLMRELRAFCMTVFYCRANVCVCVGR